MGPNGGSLATDSVSATNQTLLQNIFLFYLLLRENTIPSIAEDLLFDLFLRHQGAHHIKHCHRTYFYLTCFFAFTEHIQNQTLHRVSFDLFLCAPNQTLPQNLFLFYVSEPSESTPNQTLPRNQFLFSYLCATSEHTKPNITANYIFYFTCFYFTCLCATSEHTIKKKTLPQISFI
jgi:hypothetical protein